MNHLKYLMDTNICIYLLNGNAILNAKVSDIGVSLLSISYSVLAELYFGAFNSKKAVDNLHRIERFKKNLNILPDSQESAKNFGRIKSELKSQGQIIEDFDILIASIALTHNCIVVTNNVRHFSRINDLKIENWLKETKSGISIS